MTKSRALKLPASYSLCVSSRERFLASLGRNVVVADLASRKRLHSTHPLSHPSTADFSPDEGLLAVKSTWGEIALIESASGRKLASYRPSCQEEGAQIRFSADGQFLVDGSWSGEIRVRRVSDLATTEAFAFRGEMIEAVSRDSSGETWLFAHVPKYESDVAKPAPPYLSLWQWPLSSIRQRLEVSLETIDAAALSPSAQYIAVVGRCAVQRIKLIQMLSPSGELLAASPVAGGGTGSSTRWSADSGMVGTVAKGKFVVYSAPDLRLLTAIDEEFPSDLAFIGGGGEVVLGSWSRGRIVALDPSGIRLKEAKERVAIRFEE
jgi:hypothetical protein